MLRRLLPDPFLLALVATVLAASLLPARGMFAEMVGWLSTITVMLLFFLHGAKLPREQVVAGVAAWRLHLVILFGSFVLFPIAALALRWLAPGLLDARLWVGVLFLSTLPSTVQSAIAFVSIARGNVPAAIASASASQMLGVVLTPLLMATLAGTHGRGGLLGGIGGVALEILAPFVAGHLLRPWLAGALARHGRIVGLTDRSTILIAVYAAFSAAVREGLWQQLPLPGLAALVAVDLILLALMLAVTWALGRFGGFGRANRIAIQFCATKKSLVQGVPMAKVLFPPAQAGMILLPLMIFHQAQLMACAFLARRYATGVGEVA